MFTRIISGRFPGLTRARASYYVLMLLLLGSPLVVFPFLDDSSMLGKDSFAQVLILSLACCWGIEQFRAQSVVRVRFPRYVLLPLGVYFATALLSLSHAGSVYMSLTELRRVGLLFLLFILSQSMMRDSRRMRNLLSLLLVTGGVVAVYGLLQDYGIDFFERTEGVRDWRRRVVATLGSPTVLAEYLMLILPVAAGLLFGEEEKRKKLLIVGIMILMFACLMVTFSLGAVAGVLTAAVVLGGFMVKETDPVLRRRARLSLAAFAMGALLIFGFYAVPHPYNGRQETILHQAGSSADWRNGMKTRRLIWRSAANMVKDYPLTGVGIGNFRRQYLAYQGDVLQKDSAASSRESLGNNDTAHNELFHVAAETGLLGLAAFLWLMGALLRGACRAWPHGEDPRTRALGAGCIAAMAGLLVDSMVNFPLHVPATSVLFWFFAGCVTATRAESSADVSTKTFRWPRGLLVRGGLCLAVLCLFVSIITPFGGDIFTRRGRRYFYQGKTQEALGAFLTALRWNAHDPKSNVYAGAIYVAAGHYTDGIPHLRRALAGGEDVRAHLFLGQAFLAQGDLDAAIHHYGRAVHINPYHAHLHRVLAELYTRTNDAVRALRHAERARELESIGAEHPGPG